MSAVAGSAKTAALSMLVAASALSQPLVKPLARFIFLSSMKAARAAHENRPGMIGMHVPVAAHALRSGPRQSADRTESHQKSSNRTGSRPIHQREMPRRHSL